MPAVESIRSAATHRCRQGAGGSGRRVRGRRGDPTLEALEREWSELDTRATTMTVQMWGRRHPAVLAGCRSLDDVLAAVREDPDAALGALLTMAADDGCLAGLVVVRSMTPKLVVMARRDPEHELSDYVSWLWLVIRRYPLVRRPHNIAANLALDTLKQATRHRYRREVPWHQNSFVRLESRAVRLDRTDPPEGGGSLSAARVIQGALDLGLVDRWTARVLLTVYAEGVPGRQAADALGMSLDTLRWRCSRAVRRLAAHAPELLEAA